MNLLIKFYNNNKLICSDSSLSLTLDNKQIFFNSTNSWQKLTTKSSYIKIEYLCLLEKNTIDIVEIIADDWIYKIHLSKNILTKNLNTYSFNCYIDLSNCTFKKDNIDYASYHKQQIFCDQIMEATRLPTITVMVYDKLYKFDHWYNYDNSLLFLSKDDTNNTNASIQIFPTKSIFYMITHHENMKKDIIFYSISSKYNIMPNELGQIDCSQIKYHFLSLKLLEPIIIATDTYYDINNILSNIKIASQNI